MTRSRHWSRWAGAAILITALGAAAPATTASSKSSPPSGSYRGKTSKGLPVTFRIQSGKVRSLSATVHALCVSVLAP